MRAWGLWLLLLAACGGRASRSEEAEPETGSGPGGTGGASVAGMGGVSGSGGTAEGGGGAAASSLRGCPDSSWTSCKARFVLDLRFDGMSSKNADGTVWAEPLQLPPYSQPPPTHQPVSVDSADWDRSRLPAGACVFKLHGTRASCIAANFGRVSGGPCDQEERPVIPLGYYELPSCAEGLAPGCPSDDPWLGDNSVWYTVPEEDGSDDTLLVLCAGICHFFAPSEDAKMCVLGGPAP